MGIKEKVEYSPIIELEKILMIYLFGIVLVIISILCLVIKLDIKVYGLLGVSGIISFFSSGYLFDKYFTNERKLSIINNYEQPGKLKYFISMIVIFGSLIFFIICAFITAVIYRRWIIH